MTDKELLEVAAKTYGLTSYKYCDFCKCMAVWYESDGGYFGRENNWNPLKDDGDALRLSVELNIELVFMDDSQRVNAGVWSEDAKSYDCVVEYKGNKLAAARRAIVLAASKICK